MLLALLAALPTLPSASLLADTESEWQDLTAERLRTKWVHQGRGTAWAFSHLQRIHTSLRELVSGTGERTLVTRAARDDGTELTSDVCGLATARAKGSRAERGKTALATAAPAAAHVVSGHIMSTTSSASTPPSVLHFPAVGLRPSRLLDDATSRGRDASIELLLVAVRTPPVPAVGLGRGLSDLTSGTLSASESSHLL